MLRGISWVNIQGTFVNLEFCVHNRGLTFHKLDEVLHILLPNPHADQMKNIWSLCSKNKCLLANYLAQHLCYSPSPPPPFFFKNLSLLTLLICSRIFPFKTYMNLPFLTETTCISVPHFSYILNPNLVQFICSKDRFKSLVISFYGILSSSASYK